MPLYTYYCTDCNESSERNVKIALRDEQTCDCGLTLNRQVDRPALVWSPTAGGMR